MTQANHGSVFKWLGLEPNDYGPSEFRTRSEFEPPLYSSDYCPVFNVPFDCKKRKKKFNIIQLETLLRYHCSFIVKCL